MRGRAWTVQDDAVLRAAYEAGEPISKIAKFLGRTQQAVSTRRIRLGIPLREPTTEAGRKCREDRRNR